MPCTQTKKQKSRERILRSAAHLFAARGFDNVSIADVMKDARLTHGAFYAHFASKRHLYAEAVTQGARESMAARVDQAGGEVDLLKLIAGYLDLDHVQMRGPSCPLAFLATDVANREQEVRRAYTRVYRTLVATLQKQLVRGEFSRRSRALATSALMIGGIAVSRALDEDALAEDLLDACRVAAGMLSRST